jgi:hypothetical protein
MINTNIIILNKFFISNLINSAGDHNSNSQLGHIGVMIHLGGTLARGVVLAHALATLTRDKVSFLRLPDRARYAHTHTCHRCARSHNACSLRSQTHACSGMGALASVCVVLLLYKCYSRLLQACFKTFFARNFFWKSFERGSSFFFFSTEPP